MNRTRASRVTRREAAYAKAQRDLARTKPLFEEDAASQLDYSTQEQAATATDDT